MMERPSPSPAALSGLRILIIAAALAACATEPSPGTDDSPGAFAWAVPANGTYNSCAINTAGAAYCWGFDLVHPCTNQGCPVWTIPTLMPGAPAPYTAIATGGGPSCALTASGDAYCWGDAASKGLGDGVTSTSATPIHVILPSRAQRISVGFERSCAVTVDSVGYCWPDLSNPFPASIPTTLRFKSIDAGNTQTCGIDSNDDAYCWGSGYGSLGIGDRDTSCTYAVSCFQSSTPQLVVGGLKWSSISAGNTFTCGVTLDHHGYCWGAVFGNSIPDPHLGVLGNGTFTGSKSPVPVSGGLLFKQIDTGTRSACGVAIDGTAYCWGDNSKSELGVGSGAIRAASVPQRVAGSLVFESVSVDESACGVTVHHNIFCWGSPPGFGLDILGRYASPTRLNDPR